MQQWSPAIGHGGRHFRMPLVGFGWVCLVPAFQSWPPNVPPTPKKNRLYDEGWLNHWLPLRRPAIKGSPLMLSLIIRAGYEKNPIGTWPDGPPSPGRWVSPTSFSPASPAYVLPWTRQTLPVDLSMLGFLLGSKNGTKTDMTGGFKKKATLPVNLFKVKASGSELASVKRNCSHHVSKISKPLLYTLCSQYIFNFKGSIFKSGNTIGPLSKRVMSV